MPQQIVQEKIKKLEYPAKGNWVSYEVMPSDVKYKAYFQIAAHPTDWRTKIITKEYKYSDNFSFALELKFESLAISLLKSNELLLLENDWDEAGAVKIEEDTLIQAIKFLIRYAEWVDEKTSIIIKSPIIGPLSDGSIDLYWTHEKVDFVINIPTYPNMIASFYGDNQEGLYIEGKFNIEKDNPGMLLTMINLCQ